MHAWFETVRYHTSTLPQNHSRTKDASKRYRQKRVFCACNVTLQKHIRTKYREIRDFFSRNMSRRKEETVKARKYGVNSKVELPKKSFLSFRHLRPLPRSLFASLFLFSHLSGCGVSPPDLHNHKRACRRAEGNLFYSPILFPHRLRWCLQRFCLNCSPKHILDLFLHWTDVLFPKTHTAV